MSDYDRGLTRPSSVAAPDMAVDAGLRAFMLGVYNKLALGLLLSAVLAYVTSDIPAAVEHRQMSRELGTVQQGGYSVHLAWRETAGGALGPHGVLLEQRRTVLPGLYAVRFLDYFEGASEGSISIAGRDRIELHIPNTVSHGEVDRVYS